MFEAATRRALALLVLGALAAFSHAQNTPETQGGSETQDTPQPPRPGAKPLKELLAPILAKEAEIAELRVELAVATGDARAKLASETATKSRELRALKNRFDTIATGVDRSQFDAVDADFDLQKEIMTLLKPVIQQLKSATEGPREIERLRQEKRDADSLRQAAAAAVFTLDEQVRNATDPAVQARLVALREDWRKTREVNDAAARVADHEIAVRLSNRRSFFEHTGEIAGEFFKQRGVSILLALTAFAGVLVVFRLLPRSMSRVSSLRERKKRSFYARLLDVLWGVFTVLAAVAATLLVLYLENDWVLLLVVLIFVAGIGWASIRILPSLIEQVRLVLNLGGVREGDRILWDDVPYQVARLGLYTVLENPDLSGGIFRVPVRDLIGHNSRPIAQGERWFPTREGDWVILDDGTRACVAMQTPEFVRLKLPGGGPKTISTSDFLSNSPRNLSEGFRIEAVFGVDYAHQAICTTVIPARMLQVLHERLPQVVPESAIQALEVAFMNAGASSLDYEIQGDFDGSVAKSYEKIQFGIAQILVDICNEEGWVIPFTQITLHQAAS